ncbi:MAG: bifunctional metallophosphatase/5'-nucleotidase [Candidatus Riflebacteria bacterium]|nr:bifunctional metallophosphatase/5'-nucleotidase [Candidatus Riflebacteria bacterium]
MMAEEETKKKKLSFASALILYFAGFFLLLCLFWVFKPSFKSRYNLIITGLGKGRVVPFIAQFEPYKDKKMGGAEYLSSKIKELIKSFEGNPYNAVSLGNEISGTSESYFTNGEAVIESLNSYNLDAMLVGNLDFSFGFKRLCELSTKAAFKFLASNIVDESTGQIPPSFVREKISNPGGVLKVAFIGVTPHQTPFITTQKNTQGLRFSPPGPGLKQLVEENRQHGANLVVMLTLYERKRLGEDEFNALLNSKPDILIMQDYASEMPPARRFDDVVVKTVNGYNQGKEIDLLTVDLDEKTGKIASFTGFRFPVFCDEIQPDAAVLNKISGVLDKIKSIQNEVIATFSESYSRMYDEECPIGDMIADNLKESTNTEIAFQHSGGIQGNISSGAFSMGDLYSLLPFDNDIVTMDLTGLDIIEILTIAASLKRGIIQISGGEYSFSNRGIDDFELGEVKVNGSNIIATKTYRISTNSFLADGGDEFRPFRRGKKIVIGSPQRDVLKKYLTDLSASGPVRLQFADRIKRK